jgi:hypothetical protein
MALFNKWVKAWNNKDAKAFLDLHHLEFEFLFHSSGKVMKRADMSVDMVASIMGNEIIQNRRCIYENDKILVIHQFNKFVSGNKEALMITILKKDGLMWRMETGATLIN